MLLSQLRSKPFFSRQIQRHCSVTVPDHRLLFWANLNSSYLFSAPRLFVAFVKGLPPSAYPTSRIETAAGNRGCPNSLSTRDLPALRHNISSGGGFRHLFLLLSEIASLGDADFPREKQQWPPTRDDHGMAPKATSKSATHAPGRAHTRYDF